MQRGARPVVVSGWKAWKKRMNFKYSGIFWRSGPSGEIAINLVMLKINERLSTGTMWQRIVFCKSEVLS